MKITISVTQDDIENGHPGSCPTCPIALAMRRAVPSAPRLIVTNWTVFFNEDEPGCEARLPGDAMEFIHVFDTYGGTRVQPFEFDLDIPDELVPAGAS